jgi:hypothetical protein
MKFELKDAYKKTEVIRWVLVIIFMVIAQWMFGDVRMTLYTGIIGMLSHEVPTLFMGFYLALMVRAQKEDNE